MFFAGRKTTFHGGEAPRAAAFTLIEVLVVLGILAVLFAWMAGAGEAARQRAQTNRARAELALLRSAIEEYRREYGDYPPEGGGPEALHAALAGRLGPADDAIAGRDLTAGWSDAVPVEVGREGQFRFVDPWGRPYEYVPYVRALGAETFRGFVLFSTGARGGGEAIPTAAEVIPERTGARGGDRIRSAATAPNLYAED